MSNDGIGGPPAPGHGDGYPQPASQPPPGFAGAQPGAHQPPAMPQTAPQPPPQPAVASAAPGWYPMPDGGTGWWDGQQWLTAPPPAAPYEPLTTLGGVTVGFLALSGALALLSAVVDAWRYLTVKQFEADPTLGNLDRLDTGDVASIVVGLAFTASYLVGGIVFLVWLNRVFKNLNGPVRSGPTEYSSGWAVGWWFIPFANLVKPKQVMNEAWCASEPGGPDRSMEWRYLKAPALLSWWWGTLLLGGLIDRFLVGGGQADDLDVISGQLLLSVVGSILLTVAAALAIVVVRQITARNTQRAQNLGLVVE